MAGASTRSDMEAGEKLGKLVASKFIARAKKAGVKFTVGTNNANKEFSGAEYALEVIKKCGLTQNDFYLPVNKRQDGKL